MPFENFRPKPKTETAPIISENTTESKESLENQIEQETVKLDENLEVLKQQIDEMGGVEGLNNRIEFYKLGYGSGDPITNLLLLAGLITGSIGVYEGINNGFDPGLIIGVGMAGISSASLFCKKAKDWWENRKLKSLKNKAEAGGVV